MRDNLGPTTQNLKKILCDFEKAIHSAVSTVFEGRVKIQGCFFHFSSCIWKKYAILFIKKYWIIYWNIFLRVQSFGVVRNYRDNKNLRNFVRSYIGLAHVPPNRLEEAFTMVNKAYSFNDKKEDNFKTYMEQYFLKYWLHNKVWVCLCGQFVL